MIKKNGITLCWKEPKDTLKEPILYYTVEWWQEDGILYRKNLSAEDREFTFPNTSIKDRFNLSITAVSSAGLGIPIFIDLNKNSDFFGAHTLVADEYIIGILIGTLVSLLCLILCIWIFLRNYQKCNKSHGVGINNTQQSLNIETATNIVNCNKSSNTTEMFELENLLPQPLNNSSITLARNGESTSEQPYHEMKEKSEKEKRTASEKIAGNFNYMHA